MSVKHSVISGKKGDDKKYIDERVDFSTYVKHNDITGATYIIDLQTQKLVKNRFRYGKDEDNTVSDTDALVHYLKEYREEISNYIPGYFEEKDKDEPKE